MNMLKANLADNSDPEDTDALWTTFRRRFDEKSLQLKELCFSQKSAEYLSRFKTEALDLWAKKPVLQLDNKPSSDLMDISDDESSDSEAADSNPLALVLAKSLPFRAEAKVKKAPKLMIPLDSLVSSFAAESSRNASSVTIVSSVAETATTSVVLETLKELKKDNELVQERLDKQDETIKEMKTWMKKQDESSDEIKALLRALVSKQP